MLGLTAQCVLEEGDAARMSAMLAQIDGLGTEAIVYARKLGYRPALDVLAPWIVAGDIAEWHTELAYGGTFEGWVNLAADDNSAGDHFVVETEGSRTRGEVRSTGDYANFREQSAGQLT